MTKNKVINIVRCMYCQRHINPTRLMRHQEKCQMEIERIRKETEDRSKQIFEKKDSKKQSLGKSLDLSNLSKADSKRANRKEEKRPSRGTPILSKNNLYPIINCFNCREEVYLVPIRFKSGNQANRKYDMRPFQPHNCNHKKLDPLDDPRTLRIFQPKGSRYKK